MQVADQVEHRRATRAVERCTCGALLYEDDQDRVFCSASHERVLARDPRHRVSCHRDEEGTWTCHPECAVFMAQGELL